MTKFMKKLDVMGRDEQRVNLVKGKIMALPKEELIDLIQNYDAYIQVALDGKFYKTGWYPMTIGEFYVKEYIDLSKDYVSEDVDNDLFVNIECSGEFITISDILNIILK